MNFHLPIRPVGAVISFDKRGEEKAAPPPKPRVISLDGVKELRYTTPKTGLTKVGPHGLFDRKLEIVGEWGAVYNLDNGKSAISAGGLHFIVRNESGSETKIHASKVRFN